MTTSRNGSNAPSPFEETLLEEDHAATHELSLGEFVDHFPLTSATVALLAGVSITGGVVTGALARRLAVMGGPVGIALNRVVGAAVPIARATAMRTVTRAARRAVSRATGRSSD